MMPSLGLNAAAHYGDTLQPGLYYHLQLCSIYGTAATSCGLNYSNTKC